MPPWPDSEFSPKQGISTLTEAQKSWTHDEKPQACTLEICTSIWRSDRTDSILQSDGRMGASTRIQKIIAVTSKPMH